MRRTAVLIALGLALTGCVSVEWRRDTTDRRIERHEWRELVPGRDDLAICLERLGAPRHVRELPDGAALVWGWLESETRGLGVSAPVSDAFSVSLDLEDADRDLEGLVLFFDRDWVLRIARRGKLAEIAANPPALVREEP